MTVFQLQFKSQCHYHLCCPSQQSHRQPLFNLIHAHSCTAATKISTSTTTITAETQKPPTLQAKPLARQSPTSQEKHIAKTRRRGDNIARQLPTINRVRCNISEKRRNQFIFMKSIGTCRPYLLRSARPSAGAVSVWCFGTSGGVVVVVGVLGVAESSQVHLLFVGDGIVCRVAGSDTPRGPL